MASFGGIPGKLKGVFGEGSTAQQFLIWQVAAQLAGVLMGPMLQATSATVWRQDPNMPASPALLAELVARGLLPEQAGKDEAASSGVGGKSFDKMVTGARHAPDITIVLEGMRRGLVQAGNGGPGSLSVGAALDEMGIEPRWHHLIEQLAVQLPTPEAVLNALLEGQISEEEAHRRWIEGGGDPTWFTDAFNSQGSSPSPVELGVMANRGIIPWTGTGPNAVSYAQGFLEGPWRNKWEPAMLRLAEYLPPARTITALQRNGSITDAQALELYKKLGLRDDLAAAYLRDANHHATVADKHLAKAEIITLYQNHLLDAAGAAKALVALKYTAQDAAMLIKLADIKKASQAVTSSVSRIHTLYVGRKITKQAARDGLAALKLPADQVSSLVGVWDLEMAVNVRQLTPAQIESAWAYKIITEAEAIRELQVLGYSAYDAWLLLSIKNKKALPGKPAADAGVGTLA